MESGTAATGGRPVRRCDCQSRLFSSAEPGDGRRLSNPHQEKRQTRATRDSPLAPKRPRPGREPPSGAARTPPGRCRVLGSAPLSPSPRLCEQLLSLPNRKNRFSLQPVALFGRALAGSARSLTCGVTEEPVLGGVPHNRRVALPGSPGGPGPRGPLFG